MGRVKKNYRKKKNKSIFRLKPFWFLAITIGAVFFFLLIILTDSYYQLEVVNIEGADLTSEHSLRSFVDKNSKTVFNSQSLVFLPNVILKAEILRSYPHINSVEIEKKFPRTINVSISERDKKAVWCEEDADFLSCYKIDSGGVAFKRHSYKGFTITREGKNEFSLGEEVFERDNIDFLFEVKDYLEDDFEFQVERMSIPHDRSLFTQTDTVEIRFDFEDDLDSQIERLEILLSEEISETEDLKYIELRYGNSVYYK